MVEDLKLLKRKGENGEEFGLLDEKEASRNVLLICS